MTSEVDPISGKEIRRSGLIRKFQGNINPLLIDSTLDDRLFGVATNTDSDEVPRAFGFESVYPNPALGPIFVRVSTMSHTIAYLSFLPIF
ncbi:MAG: hypothetical protein O3A65_08705 [Proteobacteria bacterium]|nr:hypothetical protein [Pseudomonadota bacterium]